jgi:probable addiction module antidote protein
MALELKRWDIQDSLNSEEAIEAYLEAIFEDGDPKLIAAGLGDIAKARGMTKIAKATGMTREGLYKALNPTGNPELVTIVKVMKALGFQLSAKAA